MIFPCRALEEGNMNQVVDKDEMSRSLFVHSGRSMPWERQTDIDQWTKKYIGKTLGGVLTEQVKMELDGITDYISQFAGRLRKWVPDVDLFRGNMTAPSLARMIGYKLAASTNLYIPGPKEGERINKLFRDNMAGGPLLMLLMQAMWRTSK